MIYLNGPGLEARGKADALIDVYGAEVATRELWERCSAEKRHPKGKVLILVLENGPFDAAAVADSPSEWDVLNDPKDMRHQTALVADLSRVTYLINAEVLAAALKCGILEA